MTTQQRADILLQHWWSLWALPPKERGERIDALLATMPGNDNDTAAQAAVREVMETDSHV